MTMQNEKLIADLTAQVEALQQRTAQYHNAIARALVLSGRSNGAVVSEMAAELRRGLEV